ncbi:MAG: protein-export membrane protein SecD [Gammaproteobacteria bacterium RIFCSPHIGHO2_12_FULL_42_10]|nr:MAG: protein-export membrane protein SecD [Gammaproteobacteria bacterium RIFCSPHIGHO2_12_FULL_42_10]
MNHFSFWKYLLIIFIMIIALIYAAPNLYGEDPAVQIMGSAGSVSLNNQTMTTVTEALKKVGIIYQDAFFQDQTLIIRFASQEDELKAKEVIQQTLGEQYIIALNLFPRTPHWLRSIGAMPMKLGLDLRGGVHFLLQVDVDAVMNERLSGDLRGIGRALREAHIRYTAINRTGTSNVSLLFHDHDTAVEAHHFVTHQYPEFTWEMSHAATESDWTLKGSLSPQVMNETRLETLEQAMNTLRHRVNELGVSEAVVQAQGANRVSVDLPGIQDTAEAKNILGKTATLEFHMLDVSADAVVAQNTGVVPVDTRLYMDHDRPLLLKNQIVLYGSSIVSASAGMGEDGRPNVSVRLNGAGESLFTTVTAENIGKPMAVMYVEVQSTPAVENGKAVIHYQTLRRIISVATIQSALGSHFQISGLRDQTESRTLALLLRAGALPAPVTIIEEREIGPSLGEQNIRMGVLSVEVGMGLVIVFMMLYYGMFGLIADLALLMNLVLIVALLSLLGATLTLPGIAGIVLTVGMAVDANVLIFERIREELRRGVGIQNSVHLGYHKAFITIFDANVTTLIVMLILFSLGSGVVKGIAITVTIGLITSLFTAMLGTRAIVNLLYGKRTIKVLPIGV